VDCALLLTVSAMQNKEVTLAPAKRGSKKRDSGPPDGNLMDHAFRVN